MVTMNFLMVEEYDENNENGEAIVARRVSREINSRCC
jgi:hypothetical protein